MSEAQDRPPRDLEQALPDRSSALLAAGLFVTLIGLGCAALVPLTVLASVLSPAGAEPRSTAAVSGFYAVMAAAFVWLGVGAARARRWARDLLLSVSRIWLLTGVCTLLLGAFVVPAVVRSTLVAANIAPEVMTVVIAAVLAFVALSQVVLPAGLLLFFRSPGVAATCRARGPWPQFTDGCPDKVVTLASVWALAAVSVLVMPAYDFAFPFFGVLFRGAAGALPWALVLVGCGVLAWGSCRRAPWAWWTGVGATVAAALATVSTTLVLGPGKLMAELRSAAAGGGHVLEIPTLPTWAAVSGWLVVWGTFLLYLWSLRHFFTPREAADA